MSSLYLRILEQHNIVPNFWMSEEYFEKAGLEERNEKGLVGIYDVGVPICPLLRIETGYATPSTATDFVWSDFEDFTGYEGWEKEPLDLEYVYDPREFIRMEGGQWQVFRKNSRKFPRRYNKEVYYLTYEQAVAWKSDSEIHDKIVGLATTWLDYSNQKTIEDGLVLEKYLLFGRNREFLVDSDHNLLGMNIYDENYMRINFRYSFHNPQYDFLSEYLRLCFYKNLKMRASFKFVNDGGVLDREELMRFKDKMNPVKVRTVYSWRRK